MDTAATYLLPGKTALVAEVEEGSTGPIDTAVARHGGIVYREAVSLTHARRDDSMDAVTGPRCAAPRRESDTEVRNHGYRHEESTGRRLAADDGTDPDGGWAQFDDPELFFNGAVDAMHAS